MEGDLLENARLMHMAVKTIENELETIHQGIREAQAARVAEVLRAERAADPERALGARIASLESRLQEMDEQHEHAMRAKKTELDAVEKDMLAIKADLHTATTIADEREKEVMAAEETLQETQHLLGRIRDERSKRAMRITGVYAKLQAAAEAAEVVRVSESRIEEGRHRRMALQQELRALEQENERVASRVRDLQVLTQQYEEARRDFAEVEQEKERLQQLLQRVGGIMGQA